MVSEICELIVDSGHRVMDFWPKGLKKRKTVRIIYQRALVGGFTMNQLNVIGCA